MVETFEGRDAVRHACLTLAFCCIWAGPSLAADPRTDAAALRFEWDLRARHEHVEDDAFSPTADAATLRLRAGVRAEFGGGWSALIEGEGIANAGDGYNSGANGRAAYSAVIDPTGAELNQAWVGWKNERFGASP
jgi:hypothetical protein